MSPQDMWQVEQLRAKHGRLPCPECGGMIEAEPDANSAYCYDCSKAVHWKNPMG